MLFHLHSLSKNLDILVFLAFSKLQNRQWKQQNANENSDFLELLNLFWTKMTKTRKSLQTICVFQNVNARFKQIFRLQNRILVLNSFVFGRQQNRKIPTNSKKRRFLTFVLTHHLVFQIVMPSPKTLLLHLWRY